MNRLVPELPRASLTWIGSLVAGAIGLFSLVLFASLPAWPRIWAVLNDAAHGPVFGMLAIIFLALLGFVSRRGAVPLFAAAFVLAILTGIVVEWIQGMIGRDSSWKDVGTDALGAALALGLAGWRPIAGCPSFESRPGRRAAFGVALLAGTLLLAPVIEAGLAYARRAAQFPVIARFDSPLDLYFSRVQSAAGRRAELPEAWARAGDVKSLRIESTSGLWPGFVMEEPAPDWTGRKTLNLDLTNPGPAPIQLTIRVHDVSHDQRHEDRFNRTFLLEPGRMTLTIATADVASAPTGRRLDLNHVGGIIVYASDVTQYPGLVFYLTKIWLE